VAGELTEGIIGTPRFINPVLAVSDVDQDLTQLVYSGLVKISSDNKIVPDLAEYYEISDDGLEYKFILRDKCIFS
jgi:ABC-type transport system substrate-binding protein